MDRRQFNSFTVLALAAILAMAQEQALALSLSDLTNAEASTGLKAALEKGARSAVCLLYTSPSPRDRQKSRMPSSA